MDNEYQLHDSEAAQALLRRFGGAARKKGEALVRAGAVRELSLVEPGLAYRGVLEDGEKWLVTVGYQGENGRGRWTGECSCPQGSDCGHVFAVMRELLAQHSAAEVRSLSAGAHRPVKGQAQPISSRELGPLLTAALGRQLTKPEVLFVRQVQNVYTRSRQTGHITYWDFEEMRLPLKQGYGWESLVIWPATPKSEHEFWLYVANAARERGVALPEFMEPITDLGEIQQALAQWRRRLEVQRWQQILGAFNAGGTSRTFAEGEIDLRLVIDGTQMRLEWRRPGESEFQTVKPAHFRHLSSGHQMGTLWLTPEAEWLWQGAGELLSYGPSIDWSRAHLGRALGRILRLGIIGSRIVRPDGEPFPRIPEPLRWELGPAQSEQDDYQLRLVQADGSPLPKPHVVVFGNPPLYLTANGVFTGPACPDTLLDAQKENRIPAPALETAAGVALLQTLSITLPPRLKDRVQTVSYHVTLHCELRRSGSASGPEECAIKVDAHAPDGKWLVWSGYEWLNIAPNPRKLSGDPDRITLYDSAILEETKMLLDPLQLRPASSGGGLVMRVTRRFPEQFSEWLKTIPPQITVELAGDLACFTDPTVAGRVKLDVTETEIDWFDLSVVLDVSDATLTQEEIDLLLKAKGGYVRLRGKGWRRLQFDISDEEHERLARLGLSAREFSGEPQRLHALQLADEAAKTFLPQAQVEKIQRRAEEIVARVAPPLPAGVTAELRPYQVEGFHFLAYLSTNRFGGILADDMGLGKTLQTLAWLLWLREGGSDWPASGAAERKPSLVVCPKSVMDNWRAETERFTPGLRVRVWSAAELENFSSEVGSADLHVLNYSQLRSLGEGLIPVRWQALILDEGQYIKNPNSQTAQVARALRADHRLVLSGTPIENRLLDLWSLMAFAMPGVLSSRAHFARLYDAKGDLMARRRLAARVRPFLLRRTKTQVAKDLPDRIEEDLFCELEGEQQLLYRAELKRAQQLLLGIKTQKELAKQQFHFLVSLLRLRQICCDPRLRDAESAAPSAKTEALLDVLEPLMEEEQKVLVFSQFVELLELLRPMLAARGWPVFYLAGHTENRGELVEQFQSAPGAGIFLISLKAGGFGLNLTAASYVVLFDPWWNPAVENQAIDRTHRIGQVNKVIAYRLLIKNSIEEKIRHLQKQKQALAEDVLGEERFSQSLTLNDLRFLFAD